MTSPVLSRKDSGEDLYGTQTFALWNFILQALRAHTLFKNGVDYIVKDGEAVIIDEAGLLTDGEKKSLIEDMQPITEYGNVMFYPIEGKNPYRVCLKYNNVKEEKEKGKDPA